MTRTGEILDVVARIDTRWALVACLVVIDLWAVSLILRAKASARDKALWSAVVVLCPVVGCLFWFVLGPKPNLLGRSAREG